MGFADLLIETLGLSIHDCTVHEQNGARWVGLPGKEYTDPKTGFSWVNRFLARNPDELAALNQAAEEFLDGALRQMIYDRAEVDAQAGNWRDSIFVKLRHDIIECNLLEKRRDDWQRFISELLQDGQLRAAVAAQAECQAALDQATEHTFTG